MTRLVEGGRSVRVDEPELRSGGQRVETITAELVLWRLFGLNERYEDLPRSWAADEGRGPNTGDRIRVTLGSVPEDLVVSLRQSRAQADGILAMLVTGGVRSEADLLARYHNDLPSIALPEFEDPSPAWLSIRLSRPLKLDARVGATLRWAADIHALLRALDEFELEGNRYLDGTVGRLVGALGTTNLGTLRYDGRRAMAVAEGRASLSAPRLDMQIRDSGPIVGRQLGYAARLLASLNETVSALPKGSEVGALTHVAARWFCAARGEEDDLRRFVFAFAGIEALVTSAGKASRGKVLQRIAAIDRTLPAPELLWPGTNEEYIYRNLVFRFAVTSAAYSPASAAADTNLFKELLRKRNLLFHGSNENIGRTVSLQCAELLQKYLGLVAMATP